MRDVFSRDLSRLGLMLVAGCLVTVVSGCASSNKDTAQRRQAPAVIIDTDTTSAGEGVSTALRKTGTYPSLGGPLRAANRQLSATDVSSMSSQLQALSNARATGVISDAEYKTRLAELEKLSATHGAETLKQIEQ
ncbi:hypothetical protein IFT84_14520 [Rhizobium sp. CFBP 8762]|uniref:hypothetical protein n=1 Tax=Rhizobium sp. CFBP 8762 TaxID=2775279 RepID=UPI00178288CA|nr:hypothetical protein [Rhizobium sp. CFBP 8762]MBD8555718.1 hypothetical protein [Rhizobium sp. CFBP 8762]